MNKIILLLLATFTASVLAAEPVPAFKSTMQVPTVKVKMSRTKKRQMMIYYASRGSDINNSDPGPDADDLDIQVGYRRPELAYDAAALDADTIPDHILKRLLQARQAAVTRHQEIWC